MMDLYGHPFSSYSWKAMIAFYENAIPFTFRTVGPDEPENGEKLRQLSPQGKFPLLVDGDRVIFEATIIIEYLDSQYPGPVKLIPKDRVAATDVRMLDRFFDNYVMTPMQAIVGDFMRDPAKRDALTVEQSKARLDRSYQWLEKRLGVHEFVCGDDFTMADCAAAPALFYADWVVGIPDDLVNLRGYRKRLLARPAVARCVEAARPYRGFFPPGAPDRD